MKAFLSVFVLQFLSFVLMTGDNIPKIQLSIANAETSGKAKSRSLSKLRKDDETYNEIINFLESSDFSFNKTNLAEITVTGNGVKNVDTDILIDMKSNVDLSNGSNNDCAVDMEPQPFNNVSSTTSHTLQSEPDLLTTLKTYKNDLDQHVQNLSKVSNQIREVELTLPNSIKEKLDQIPNVREKINWIEKSQTKKDKSLLNYLAMLKDKNTCIADYNKFVSGLPSEFRLKTTPTNIQNLFLARIKKLEKDVMKSVNDMKHPQPKNESEEKKDTELDFNKSATDQKSKKDEKKIPETQTSNIDENLDEKSKTAKNMPEESLKTVSGESTRKESMDNNEKSLSNDIPSVKGFKILVGMLGSFAGLLLISIKFV